jgi:hypothetical protein
MDTGYVSQFQSQAAMRREKEHSVSINKKIGENM